MIEQAWRIGELLCWLTGKHKWRRKKGAYRTIMPEAFREKVCKRCGMIVPIKPRKPRTT